jgi:hypothetical protein
MAELRVIAGEWWIAFVKNHRRRRRMFAQYANLVQDVAQQQGVASRFPGANQAVPD